MPQTVADVLVGTLEQVGVKHIFGLIGDSLNPVADAVRRSRIFFSATSLYIRRRSIRRSRHRASFIKRSQPPMRVGALPI
jgi:hypothetical protein